MAELYGWAGKVLRVDLSSGQISTEDTTKWVPKFLGGKGMMHRIAWEEIPRGMGAFDPENLLMISVGPCTGTSSPTSGRVEIGGIAPQTTPEMYSHSGIGGWFGAELKWAGFDAIIIKGESPSPCYLWVTDNKAEIKDAKDLWGLGTYATQEELFKKHGKDAASIVIGPAGEHKSRIACMLTQSSSAAGQGGFGGLAGAKKLKAVCIKGSQSVKIANPDALIEIHRQLDAVYTKPRLRPAKKDAKYGWDGHYIESVPYELFRVSKEHGDTRSGNKVWKDVPIITRPRSRTQQTECIGPMVFGWEHCGSWGGKPMVEWPLWDINFERGSETSELIQQYGLNEWEILGGMVPWIVMAGHEGLITEQDFGFPINPSDVEWWPKFLHMLTYREGFGDLLAEGVTRAINTLGYQKYGRTIYTGHHGFGAQELPIPVSLQEAWGYSGHWSGRGIHSALPFPEWLTRSLTWMTQTRDSNNDTHHKELPEWKEEFYKDPYRGPWGPFMAIYDERQSEIKCALTGSDSYFPRANISFEGAPNVPAWLYSAVTGIETTDEEMDKIADRLKNQVRAVLMRNNDRDRAQETSEILEFFRIGDGTDGTVIDEAEWSIMVDHYYEQRGWDKTTGWPTRATLEDLDLKDVADELGSLGKLP